MKKILLAFTATALSALMMFNPSYAQSAKSSFPEKSIVFSDENLSGDNTGLRMINDNNLSSINVRAIRSFTKSFKGVENASWFKTKDGGYIASFTDNSIKNVVCYTSKGVFHHMIRYYGEKTLPKEIRARVKSTYYDFDIITVAEVHYNDQVTYVLTMQDDSNIQWLSVSDEDMQVVKHFKRQAPSID